MAIFGTSGGLINAGLGILGNVFGGNTTGIAGALGTIGNVGSSFLSTLTQPSANLPVIAGGPVAQPVASRVPQLAGPIMRSMGRIGAMAANTLARMAGRMGRRSLSLRQALSTIKRLGKFMEPALIASALGVTTAELADLIFEGSRFPRRRMNAGNAKALRRAMRRLESFHKLCVRADVLRTRGRGRSRRPCATGSPLVVRGG
jgi:hypothetical protein